MRIARQTGLILRRLADHAASLVSVVARRYSLWIPRRRLHIVIGRALTGALPAVLRKHVGVRAARVPIQKISIIIVLLVGQSIVLLAQACITGPLLVYLEVADTLVLIFLIGHIVGASTSEHAEVKRAHESRRPIINLALIRVFSLRRRAILLIVLLGNVLFEMRDVATVRFKVLVQLFYLLVLVVNLFLSLLAKHNHGCVRLLHLLLEVVSLALNGSLIVFQLLNMLGLFLLLLLKLLVQGGHNGFQRRLVHLVFLALVLGGAIEDLSGQSLASVRALLQLLILFSEHLQLPFQLLVLLEAALQLLTLVRAPLTVRHAVFG